MPLAAGISAANVIYVPASTTSTTCTGTVASPTAPAGDLCIYAGTEELVGAAFKNVTNETGAAGASKFGAAIAFEGTATGEGNKVFALGVWAVTAPYSAGPLLDGTRPHGVGCNRGPDRNGNGVPGRTANRQPFQKI